MDNCLIRQLGDYMKEKIIYAKILGGKELLITVDTEKQADNRFCYVKIGQKWSIQKTEDIATIIVAFEHEKWELLDNVNGCKNCLWHDLFDANIISEKEWVMLRE